MAPQPKKRNSKSSTQKKKTTAKKTLLNKRTRKKTTKKPNPKKHIFIVLGVFLMISLVTFGYFLGQYDMKNGQTPMSQVYKTHDAENKKKLLDDLSNIKTQKPKEKKETSLSKVPLVAKVETKVKEKKKKPQAVKKQKNTSLASLSGKPKLVIIIDDVSSSAQLKRIKALDIKVTPSIFPPSELSMKSHRLAKGLKHYMIHLPLESGSKQFNKQYKTLKTTFTKAQIETRAKELRKLFPTARYINNHTGSVYTNDYKAMQTLYAALRAEGFVFVDSRTIASTKVPKIAAKVGDAYVGRDIFIDNEHTVPYIHAQLRRAVTMAKKKGYAIAIGHPHKMTMKALASAGSIFKEVELVYIDEIYKN
ncbi:MAG: hypothetical protein COB07_10170 [Sulfurovum sp.]|nr:MAG: hypothetical protein COB07_10170 [Sulfurovum sp.]